MASLTAAGDNTGPTGKVARRARGGLSLWRCRRSAVHFRLPVFGLSFQCFCWRPSAANCAAMASIRVISSAVASTGFSLNSIVSISSLILQSYHVPGRSQVDFKRSIFPDPAAVASRASVDDRPVVIVADNNPLIALASGANVVRFPEVGKSGRAAVFGFGGSPCSYIVKRENDNPRAGAIKVESVAGGGGNGRVVVRVEFGFCAGRADFAAFDDCPISYAKIRAPA